MRLFVQLHWLEVSLHRQTAAHVFKNAFYDPVLLAPPLPTPLPASLLHLPMSDSLQLRWPSGGAEGKKQTPLTTSPINYIGNSRPVSQAAVSFAKEYVWRMTFIRPRAIVEVRPRSLITFGTAILHSSSHLTELMDNDAAHPCPFTGGWPGETPHNCDRQTAFFFFSFHVCILDEARALRR